VEEMFDIIDMVRAEGELRGKVETAKNMLSLGLDFEVICKATGLPQEDIAKLQEEVGM
jgi:predicted transposase/invertase (TIGR01784 family)